MRRGEIEIAAVVKGHSLRASEAAIGDVDFATGVDTVNAVETGSGRPSNIEHLIRAHRQVVSRNRRFQRREDKDLTARADLENGSGAVPDVEILFFVERQSGGHAHSLGIDFDLTARADGIDRAVVAARDQQVPVPVENQAGGVDDIRNEGFYVEIQVDFEDGNRQLFTARPASGREDVAVRVDGGVGNRVQVLRDRDAYGASIGLAFGGAVEQRQLALRRILRNTDHQKTAAAHDQPRVHRPEPGAGVARSVAGKARTTNFHLSALDGGAGRDAFDQGLSPRTGLF